jgi:cytoskeletal protein CcmA (bactofilin family)
MLGKAYTFVAGPISYFGDRKLKTNHMPNSSARSARESAAPGAIATQDAINTTVISGGSKLNGNFSSSENIRFDGAIHGELSCEKKLVIGREGRVEGDVKAKEAFIMGQVKGNIHISGLLHLEKNAVVRGNILAGVISIEDGAVYDGICKVGVQ